jgi:hypothetical protein
MKIFPLILVAAFTAVSFLPAPSSAFIDPTGTYVLKGETKKNHIISHSGEIRIKLLDEHTVAMSFFVCKGYPNYETGSFIDTLRYENNRALYRPAGDGGCAIAFWFDELAASTEQYFTDPTSGCGFAKGVMISASFGKRSSQVPVIQDLSARISH